MKCQKVLKSSDSHIEVSHSSTLLYLECKTSANKWQTSGHFWPTWDSMILLLGGTVNPQLKEPRKQKSFLLVPCIVFHGFHDCLDFCQDVFHLYETSAQLTPLKMNEFHSEEVKLLHAISFVSYFTTFKHM